MGKLLGEREDVPDQKKYMVSTRANSDYKWQNDQLLPGKGVSCVGALEFPSEPSLNLRGDITQHVIADDNPQFCKALEIWHGRKLRRAFVHACEDIPRPTFCCGLLPDDGQYLKDLEREMNKGWVYKMNQELMQDETATVPSLAEHGSDENATKQLQLNVYLWTLNKITGSSQTQILMVRFLAVPPLNQHV